MTTEVNQVLKKTEQGIAKWNQVKQEKIDFVIEQLTKFVELVAMPETKIGFQSGVTTDIAKDIVHEFIVERNSILFGFETKDEYRKAVRARAQKWKDSILEENENG